MSENKNEDIIEHIIENKGIKLTPQRKEILKVFLKSKEKHLSAYKIKELLRKDNKNPGLATIYRTLNLFEKNNIVQKREFNEKYACYELVYNKGNHIHLICKECGKIIEMENILPENIEEKIMDKKGFECVNYSIKIYGYCENCQ